MQPTTKYGVFDNNKEASSKGFPKLKTPGWNNHIFNSFEEAKAYAESWLGEHAGSVRLDTPDKPEDYSGYGDMIEIRTMKEEKELKSTLLSLPKEDLEAAVSSGADEVSGGTDMDMMVQTITLEQQLFSYEEWDSVDEGVYLYFSVVLKENIGKVGNTPLGCEDVPEFPAGHKFACAVMNYQKSTVTFHDTSEEDEGHEYPLLLNVGRKIEKSDTIPCPPPMSDAALLEAAGRGAPPVQK